MGNDVIKVRNVFERGYTGKIGGILGAGAGSHGYTRISDGSYQNGRTRNNKAKQLNPLASSNKLFRDLWGSNERARIRDRFHVLLFYGVAKLTVYIIETTLRAIKRRTQF